VTAMRDGKSLEEEARQVDVKARRQMGETQLAKDTQLDVATRELLKQIDKAATIAKKPDPAKPATRATATTSEKSKGSDKDAALDKSKPVGSK
jgi:hypothetical protein